MGYLVTAKTYDKDGNEITDGAPVSQPSSIDGKWCRTVC